MMRYRSSEISSGEELLSSVIYSISSINHWDRPAIEEGNKIAPSFSRIFKEMILIVNPDKPLPRVGKGTVAKKAALTLYEAEINKL